MKKQYMDFVPAKSAKPVREVATKKVAARSRVVTRVVKQAAPVKKAAPVAGVTSVKKAATVVNSTKKAAPVVVSPRAFSSEKPQLGVIEDLGLQSTRTEVEKRPLGAKNSELKKIKGQKIGNRAKVSPMTLTNKPAETEKVFKAPKSPFINQEKVVKRPLSKNVYQKKIEIPKEEPKGPVTIINKPEKDAKAGLVITIILTIILGAAAGTVAFLLLPK